MRYSLAVCLAVSTLLVASLATSAVGLDRAIPGDRSTGIGSTARLVSPSGAALQISHLPAAPPAVTPTTTIIAANGSVSNASAPIAISGAVYTITSSFSGEILDERNNSRLTSSGATVSGVNASAPVVEVFGVHNVSVQGFSIAGGGPGLSIADSVDVSVRDVTGATSNSPGLEVSASESTLVENVSMAGSTGTGFLVQGSDGTQVSNSNANGRAAGVIVDGSLNTSLTADDVSATQTGVNASADSVLSLTGNSINHTGTGVSLNNVVSASLQGDFAITSQTALVASGVTLLNATGETFTGAATGVSLTQSNRADLSENTLTGDGQGIVAVGDGALTLGYNNLSGFASVGIELMNVVSADIAANAISASTTGTGVGIESIDSADVLEFANVVVGDPSGMIDLGGINVTFSENAVTRSGSGGAGIELENDAEVTVYRNDFTNLSQVALAALGVRAVALTSNYFAGSGQAGIVVNNGSGVSIAHNSIDNPGPLGLSVVNSSGAVVWGNTILRTAGGPTGTGIFANADDSPQVAFNNVSDVQLGIVVTNTTGVSAVGNNASHLETGLTLSGVASSLVVSNNFWFDNRSFSVASDLNVEIYHNNFGQDAGWAIAPGAESLVWDAGYPEGGNFWSNHTGPDLKDGADQQGTGPDGIVDTDLPVGAAGTDRYPLTVPWTPWYAEFTESGLLVFTPWSLIINGERFNGVAGAPIVYPESNAANATVAWKVLPVPGFTLAGVSVGGPWPEQRGQNLTYTIPFFPDRFNASFEEYGLNPGTRWVFVVNGQPEGGSTPTVVVSLPNGTYNYLAGSVVGYNLTVGAGMITVAGPGALVLIVYVPLGAPAASAATSSTTTELLAAGLGIAGVIALAFLGLYLRERRRSRGPPPLTAARVESSSDVRVDGGRNG